MKRSLYTQLKQLKYLYLIKSTVILKVYFAVLGLINKLYLDSSYANY